MVDAVVRNRLNAAPTDQQQAAVYTGWPKSYTSLNHHIDATVQDKIKRISLKCPQSS